MTSPTPATSTEAAAPAAKRRGPSLSRWSRKKRTKKPNDGSMSIVEHLQELRKRVLLALVAIGVGTILGYIWYGTHVGPISSLGEILRGPYCSLPPEQRFGGSNGECRLLATGPFEMFLLRLKVGFLAGLVFSSPFWLGQIWAFITPGLKKNEKRWTLGVSIVASFLFLVGAVLAYFVLALGLGFLLTLGDEAQIAALNGERYFSFAISLLLIFGVSFEVPLLTVLLNAAGVISYKQLNEKRRYIIAFLFVFAAFITPGQDPISMVILALALCLMMEIATQIARVNDRRRAQREQEWLNDDDDSASAIDQAAPITPAGSLGVSDDGAVGASAIDAPTSVRADGTPIVASPAPRSSSGARPMAPENYGRREGLDLHSQVNSAPGTPAVASPNNNTQPGANGTQAGSGSPNTTPGQAGNAGGGFFDDVL